MDGFNDANLQCQARMKGFATLNELLVTLKSVTLKDRESSSSSTSSRPTCSSQHHAPKPSVTNGQAGHKASECRRPNRAPGSCIECWSNLNQDQNCPVKRREEAPSRAPADSTTHQIDKTVSIPARGATLRLKFKLTNEYYFLDLGSPISLLRVDCVPPEVIKPFYSKFYGMNNSELKLLGIFDTEIDIKLPVTFLYYSCCQ